MLYLYLLMDSLCKEYDSFIVSHSEIPDEQVVLRLTNELVRIENKTDNTLILSDPYPYGVVEKRIIEIDEKVHL